MKKFFTLFMVFASLSGFGQGIVLKYANQVVNSNDTITVIATELNTDNTIFIDIENTTSQELGIMVQRQIISLINNATTSFCIGDLCLDADLSVFPEIISAGGSLTHAAQGDRAFHIFYNPNGSYGVSLIKFTFFDQTTPTIASSVYLRIDNTVSVSETKPNNALSAYPNPAIDKVTIEHSLNSNATDAKLVIRNITGVIVYSSLIGNSTKTSILLNDFTSGIYFYSIELNNKSIITKKLIVK
jgi:ABC-type microcin C transport system duplicated ATPase subunit YejF